MELLFDPAKDYNHIPQAEHILVLNPPHGNGRKFQSYAAGGSVLRRERQQGPRDRVGRARPAIARTGADAGQISTVLHATVAPGRRYLQG
ncbi:hypothetical protein [Microvirga tunisiensis]|uniref:hypothetical protein n=1 Tax=Microvirga tunisiensis TaxID=2108360 RepID=UPI001FCEE596|nr:hypothetical protein [Microvirga tunisiensis]